MQLFSLLGLTGGWRKGISGSTALVRGWLPGTFVKCLSKEQDPLVLYIPPLRVWMFPLWFYMWFRGQGKARGKGLERSSVPSRLRTDCFILEQRTPGLHHCSSHVLSPPEDEGRPCTGLGAYPASGLRTFKFFSNHSLIAIRAWAPHVGSPSWGRGRRAREGVLQSL